MPGQPNIVIVMTDQQRADLCAREGYPLDTTPTLDALARQGTWFRRAYTSAPVCAPARVSMLTGRYPSATRVRSNHNVEDATYEMDLVDVLRGEGYATAMVGKNHSHLTPERVDHWFSLGHAAGYGQPGRTAEEEGFDQYLHDLHHRAAMAPAPFPLACQGPYRAVSDAQQWIESLRDHAVELGTPLIHTGIRCPAMDRVTAGAALFSVADVCRAAQPLPGARAILFNVSGRGAAAGTR